MEHAFDSEATLKFDRRFVAVMALALYGVVMEEDDDCARIAQVIDQNKWRHLVYHASEQPNFTGALEDLFEEHGWDNGIVYGSSLFLKNYGGINAVVRGAELERKQQEDELAESLRFHRTADAKRRSAKRAADEGVTGQTSDTADEKAGNVNPEILNKLREFGINPDDCEIHVVNLSDVLGKASGG
jgi:hypothetical protein